MGQLTRGGPHQYAASLVSQERYYPKPYPCLKEHQLIETVLMRATCQTRSYLYGRLI